MKTARAHFHPMGVSLEADSVAEHEVGIRPIRQALGPYWSGRQDENPAVGLARRQCPPTDLVTLREDLLFFYAGDYYDSQDPRSAWSDRGFQVVAQTPEQRFMLRDLQAAAQKGRLVICMGAVEGVVDQVWSPVCGMHLLLADRISPRIVAEWEASDRQRQDLRARWVREAGTNFEGYLRSKGCSWYALASSFSEGPQGGLRTWLNPMDQDLYHAGWFTVQDLRLWGQGRGPVIKSHR